MDDRESQGLIRLLSIGMILAAISLSSCNLAGPASPTPTIALPSPSPVPPTITPSPNPPTVTIPPATATPSEVRILFAAGATAGIQSATLNPGQSLDYILTASQTQPLIVIADSPNHDVTLGIRGLNSSNILLDPIKKWTTWEGILPATQDYLITVHAGATTESFTLTVIIPSRITFAQGAATVTVNGSTPGGLIVSYVLYALAGQKMSAALNAPSGTAVLSIYGFEDGQPLLGAASNAMIWNGTLPVTEDYIVQVVPQGGQVIGYSLTVTVQGP